jgi:DNA-binding Lrp family transcriptional regulator
MPTEEDLAILRALHDAAARSALELRASTNLSVPVLVARLKALSSQGYVTSAGPTTGASEDAQIGYVLTFKGNEAIGRTP